MKTPWALVNSVEIDGSIFIADADGRILVLLYDSPAVLQNEAEAQAAILKLGDIIVSAVNGDRTTVDRYQLAHKVFDAVFNAFESFREDNVGADLAYLMGAILDGDNAFVDWSKEAMDEPPKILTVLQREFPTESPLWKFIVLECDEEGGDSDASNT